MIHYQRVKLIVLHQRKSFPSVFDFLPVQPVKFLGQKGLWPLAGFGGKGWAERGVLSLVRECATHLTCWCGFVKDHR